METILDGQSRDACLSTEGVKQAIAQRALLKQLGITHVLVSPMRRAIHTALLACVDPSEEDPVERARPVVIVLMPCLREQVTFKNTVASSVQEIERFIDSVILEHKIPSTKLLIDYSLLKKANDLWYLDAISKSALRKELT